jgi:hypothetical protein
MRTYGRVYAADGSYQWVEVSTDANGFNDLVYITTLAQTLKLNLGESPFWANYGLPAKQSVLQQVAPDFQVALTQQQFAPFFAALTVARLPSAQVNPDTPTYRINAVTNQGATITANIPA